MEIKETLLSKSDFLDLPKVVEARQKVDELKSREQGLKISDVCDNEGHQYINLVQEGGGVLGIALVGFTYILEYAGIRFWRLAGTSAGAINAMFLAAIKAKNETKSEEILEELAAVKLISFADGASVVPSVLMRKSDYLKNIVTAYFGLVAILLLSFVLLSFHYNSTFAKFSALLFCSLAFLALLFGGLWRRFKFRAWGLCRGLVFHEWVKNILSKYKVNTLADLKQKAFLSSTSCNLVYERGMAGDIDPSDLTLISCDITQGLKVEFPKDITLYGLDDTIDPSIFVRASMSIPVFFEKFLITNDKILDSNVVEAWKNIGHSGLISKDNFFVDGGIVSNFPINIFHNANAKIPRLPVLGIVLDESEDVAFSLKDISFANYILRIFNTIRFHSDKDFLRKHNFYTKFCVKKVDVSDHNWLNFAMSDNEKKQLFVKGVLAGLSYLEGFDWQAYKEARMKL